MKTLSRKHRQIMILHSRGVEQRVIARKFRLSPSTVCCIIRRNTDKPVRVDREENTVAFRANRDSRKCSGCGLTPHVLPCPLCMARRHKESQKGKVQYQWV